MAATTSTLPPSTAVSSSKDRWRGATVDDLQLSPAWTVKGSESLSKTLYDATLRDFSIVPITSATSRARLIGYINVPKLQKDLQEGKAKEDTLVMDCMTRFKTKEPYTIITPDTPLEEIEAFLRIHEFAIITDRDRKFVIAFMTREDLERYKQRRPPLDA